MRHLMSHAYTVLVGFVRFNLSEKASFFKKKCLLAIFLIKKRKTSPENTNIRRRLVDNYSQYLPKGLRQNYKHFNTAKLAFDKGDFVKAMDLLLQVEYDELLLNIDAKVILLKIYYQEESYAALGAFLDSFKMFYIVKSHLLTSKLIT